MDVRAPYPGIRVTTNGNRLVAYDTEARVTDGGIFYPITPSTEMGEMYQQAYAEGVLNVFGGRKIAIECEGEHAAQGGAIAYSVTGKRTVNFTSGQGIVYGIEQYYHAPGKLSTMVLEVAARALTKHALNVHCGHDDIYAALDTGWIMLFAKDAQQASDQALILRRVTELALTPGMNIQDGFLTSHLERTFYKPEAGLIREFLGAADDLIDCPTEAQAKLFGPKRRRVPEVIDLKNPILVGPVQNQEHYMNGVVARRNNFVEPILGFLEEAYAEFERLTGRRYGMVSCYGHEDAETVFFSMGSAAENIEAAIDHLEATRGERVGSVHLNVLRPFPEKAVVEALRGKKNVIIMERSDEAMAGGNPLARDVRCALLKALEVGRSGGQSTDLPGITPDEMPRIFEGVYGLGSRDFRPEGILGAYEFATGKAARQDGKTAADGVTWFSSGIDHPYDVRSQETPSLLPEGAIACRLHSIGGWGMITTGKNLAGIIGELGDFVADRDDRVGEDGLPEEVIHISANPKYGSEKKGAPTNYFLVAAPERVRVNCDLKHVNVVLCCDPKAFTHCNPIEGLVEGGTFVWESSETPENAWTRIPKRYRQEIIDKKIQVYILPGFEIAAGATEREDLRMRMQGNSFLGAFFRVSTFLQDFGIDYDHFESVVRGQYEKKFGRFGEAVVNSNVEVMTQGYKRPQLVPYGDVDAPDESNMRGRPLLPFDHSEHGCGIPSGQGERAPIHTMEAFDDEFRAGKGYWQPASTLSAVGMMAAGTGATASKYVSRRETPVFVAENCTQCMACIAACPDTALPNTAQDVGTLLKTAAIHYVKDAEDRKQLLSEIPELESRAREEMRANVKSKEPKPFKDILRGSVNGTKVSESSWNEFFGIIDRVPLAYAKTNGIFGSRERKQEGDGGIFSIFVSDLCKGCGECVTECGDHEALVMTQDGEELNAEITAASTFLDLLPDTNKKYLGKYDPEHPEESKAATLRNHLMQQSVYRALVSGDGACAGCGEKSVLRAIATVTEAYMRPLFRAKASRLASKADGLQSGGAAALAKIKSADPEGYTRLHRAVAHLIMGFGGENEKDTITRMEGHDLSDQELVDALVAVLRQEAFNHTQLQTIEGTTPQGMSVMGMAAHTGCNTVYGSTPPNNPHPYPWMNSLFQDGATVGWLMGMSFVENHARRSVVPERLGDVILSADAGLDAEGFDTLCYMNEDRMTVQEIHELPKVWVVGGDGGMGDIGFQNVSKVVLQNRPNVNLLMLDTQVYSNTGGQNSDSSVLPGGFDMNQIGKITQGKTTEKKSLAEIFTTGHGSPYVAQVSMANAANLYKSVLDSLTYRGVGFIQSFTTCQPEHGVADDVSSVQAKAIRDCRGMPEFSFNPSLGESYQEAYDIKANPMVNQDWWQNRFAANKERYNYTVAHWAATEARFRRHLKKVKPEQAAEMIHLDDILQLITQRDVVEQHVHDPSHRSYVPDFGVVIQVDQGSKVVDMALSRQLVLFCVERRKAWRMLQSKAGVENRDYLAQKELLAKFDKGEITREEVLKRG